MDKLLEQLGYGTPLIYAAAACWLAFVSKANRALDHTKKTRLASALLR
jgi:hypothetical protein